MFLRDELAVIDVAKNETPNVEVRGSASPAATQNDKCRQEFERICGDEAMFAHRKEALEQNRMDWKLWRDAWSAAITAATAEADKAETDSRKWATRAVADLMPNAELAPEV